MYSLGANAWPKRVYMTFLEVTFGCNKDSQSIRRDRNTTRLAYW